MTPTEGAPPEGPEKGGERFSRIEVGSGGSLRIPKDPAGTCAFCGSFNEDGRRRCRGCFRLLLPARGAKDSPRIDDLASGSREPWKLPAWAFEIPDAPTMGLDRVTLLALACVGAVLGLIRVAAWWLMLGR